MCFGGIFLTSSVLEGLSFMFEDHTFKNDFINSFQHGRGEGMFNYIKKIPLSIIKAEGDLASRGCILYALQNGMLE